MSIKKWPGAVVSDTPVEPAGPYQDSAASGVWTLEQQAYWEAQGLWPVPGNTNPDSYIENLFSTYLYTGNDSTQTITNGIDLDSEGGMVWVKSRDQAGNPTIIDTARGVNKNLPTNQTYAEDSDPSISSFNSNGFSINSLYGFINDTGINYASWTFRKQPKFFDVVTYTGTGTARTVSHNLGSVPGTIIVKVTDNAGGWQVYHRSTGATKYLVLNETQAAGTSSNQWNNTAPTDSVFTVGNIDTNESGRTYVAYVFAHDAGGFGDDGLQNVISCGSYVGAGSGASTTVNLGYEPQWVLVKPATTTGPWSLIDNMRGWTADSSGDKWFEANTSGAEYLSAMLDLNATGFTTRANYSSTNSVGQTYIYIAIRRGPMATPTSGTEVFGLVTQANNINSPYVNSFTAPVIADFAINTNYTSGSAHRAVTRLTGDNALGTETANAEATLASQVFGLETNYKINIIGPNAAEGTDILWAFRRAPGFMDVVAYTGTGSNAVVKHSLSVIPEVIITKRRDTTRNWAYYTNLGASTYTAAILNDTYAPGATPASYDTALTAQPSSTDFYVGTSYDCNASTGTYVAYLFATCPGVSKVGSYTGTAADLNVDCGFTTGARFILIKRTDASGDWYVWDSARGIVAGNDPYLLLNSTAAEVTGTDYVDADPAGFTVTSSAPAGLNASGGSYIFLAIA
jgi:hypothetical protein